MPFDVRAFRKFMGWTQQELATRMGVVVRTVERWEAKGTRRIQAGATTVATMRRFENDKIAGRSTEPPVTTAPYVWRKLPPTAAAIGVAPGSGL